MAEVVVVTRNEQLQTQLLQWRDQIDAALAQPVASTQRLVLAQNFCRTFVPADVSEVDMFHYAQTLCDDEEFFLSLRRDVHCCGTGELVETIAGDQTSHAVFTILPPPGTLSENSSLEIVREVAFISHNGGIVWTAEA